MAEIDWRVDPRSVQSMTPAPSREEMAAQQQDLEKTRAGIAGSLFGTGLFPSENQTSLSTLGGVVGGIAPILFPEARVISPIMRATEAAPAAIRPFVPSLLGSSNTAPAPSPNMIQVALSV